MTVLERRIPKYLLIKRHVERMIADGRLIAGDKLPTEQEFVRHFGYSVTSVRNALNKLSEEGAIQTIQGSGSYVTQPMPQKNVVNYAPVAIYTDFSELYDPGYLQMIEGASLAARDYELRLEIIRPSHGAVSIVGDEHLRNVIEAGQIRGLIIWPVSYLSWDDFRYLEEKGIPFVIRDMCRDPKGRGIRGWIRGNWFDQIMESMFEQDLRKIGVVVGPVSGPDDFFISLGQHIVSSYKMMMLENGQTVNDDYIVAADWTAESGYVAGKKLLSLSEPPEVIVGANDMNAVGIIKAALELGYSVPQDIKVWGCGDLLHPSIVSTVSEDMKRMGVHAVSALVQVMEGGIPSMEPECSELVYRASTGDSKNSHNGLIEAWVDEYFTQNPMDQAVVKNWELQFAAATPLDIPN